MGTTNIEWADAVWNPVTGCTPISPACDHCYARRMAARLRGRCGYPADDPFRVTMHENRLDEPLSWRTPRRIFVCSMGDLFHPEVSDTFQLSIWVTMARSSRHTFLVLTKRPDRMGQFLAGRPCLPNVWLGVTAEDQEMADKRIPILLQIPAAKRFVSIEPMLGQVSLFKVPRRNEAYFRWRGETGAIGPKSEPDDYVYWRKQGLHWVICGGETGPGARPMHPAWIRSLKDECVDAGVPFFFKGWGDWCPCDEAWSTSADGETVAAEVAALSKKYRTQDGMMRRGRKYAGHLLDGREWRQLPEGNK